jgi:NADH dehydrogenase FAD-containing subunit
MHRNEIAVSQGSPDRPNVATGARTPHHIIVVGGGAGGLELVTRLGNTLGRRGVADVTLIDKSRTHLWKPLLHEVAAGSMDFAVQEMEFRAQAHWHHFHYRIGELIGLDRNKREVELAPYLDSEGAEMVGRRLFHYDMLIIAIGSHGNDFGTPGVREHAILLDSADEAKRFHERLLNSFLRAQEQFEPLKPEQMSVAIIGAGATGTELAAELRSATRQLAAYGYDRIDPEKDITINLIEAADRILPPLASLTPLAVTSSTRAEVCTRTRRSSRIVRASSASRFGVSGAWRRREGRRGVEEALTSQTDAAFLLEAAAVPDRDGGVRNSPLLGSHACCHGS